jgi:hypothetical protein
VEREVAASSYTVLGHSAMYHEVGDRIYGIFQD